MRENVSGGRPRAGADPAATGPRVGANHRAVPGDQAGSGARAERRDQVEGGGLADLFLTRMSAQSLRLLTASSNSYSRRHTIYSRFSSGLAFSVESLSQIGNGVLV